MNALFAQTVFEVAGIDYTWADVVAAADARGEWSAVQKRGLENLRWLALADAQPGAESNVDLEALAAAFRYERNLESASDTEAWLDRWTLSEGQWLNWIRAQTLRRQGAVPSSAPQNAAPEDDGDTGAREDAVHAEAVCSRDLERFAWTLAGRAAVDAVSSRDRIGEPSDRAGVIARMEKAFGEFASASATFVAVESQLASHRLDWTRVSYKTLQFANTDEAREAILTIREDGISVDEFAKSVGLRVDSTTTFLEDAEASIADHLRGTVAGQLIGPLRVGDRFRVCAVTGRIAPSLSDPLLLERARERVVQSAVAREVSRRVRWLWPI